MGFVPTMGALHEGHLSLVRLARAAADRSVVSIFVNPTQFAPGEDLERYPRQEAKDLAQLSALGVDIAYCPHASEIYPAGSLTDVRVAGLSDQLDGIYRPHFFYGVTTVVARLFAHVSPDVAVFGEKDFQQLQIIRRMVRDLGLPVQVLAGPTRRDPDGLAQSSRNAYLEPDIRRAAGAMFAALHRARVRIGLGCDSDAALDEARRLLAGAGFEPIDYVSLVDPVTLQPTQPANGPAPGRLLGAAWLSGTRLIDNLPVAPPQTSA